MVRWAMLEAGVMVPRLGVGIAVLACVVGCQGGPAPLSSAPPHAASSAAPSGAVPGRLVAGPRAVDKRDYAIGDGYYFVSPSGRFHCGIIPSEGAGCQGTTTPLPAALADCVARWGPAGPAIQLGAGPARFACLNQGIYLPNPDTRTLPYGTSLTSDGYTCASQKNGVTCRNDVTGHGFRISSGSNEVF